MCNYNFLIKLKIAIKSVKLSTQRRVESSAHKVKSGKWEEQISKVDKSGLDTRNSSEGGSSGRVKVRHMAQRPDWLYKEASYMRHIDTLDGQKRSESSMAEVME